jgi:hypothetical protein
MSRGTGCKFRLHIYLFNGYISNYRAAIHSSLFPQHIVLHVGSIPYTRTVLIPLIFSNYMGWSHQFDMPTVSYYAGEYVSRPSVSSSLGPPVLLM